MKASNDDGRRPRSARGRARRGDTASSQQGLPRRLDRGHRARRRHLAAVPVPPLRLEEGALPRRVDALRSSELYDCFAEAARGKTGEEALARWARRTCDDHARSRDAADADAEVRGRSTTIPKCVASAGRGWRDLVDLVEQASGARRTTSAASSPSGMLITILMSAMGLVEEPEPWATRLRRGLLGGAPTRSCGRHTAPLFSPLIESNHSLPIMEEHEMTPHAHPLDVRDHLDRAVHGHARQPRRHDGHPGPARPTWTRRSRASSGRSTRTR